MYFFICHNTLYRRRSVSEHHDGNGYLDSGELYRYCRTIAESSWNPYWESIRERVPSYDQEDIQFMPRISGGPVDIVLFEIE